MARKKKRGPSPAAIALAALLILSGLVGSFFLGWHFGVESTRFRGSVLLVNDTHRDAGAFGHMTDSRPAHGHLPESAGFFVIALRRFPRQIGH